MYTEKLKLGFTPDRRMPWPVRIAIHEIVDELWDGVQVPPPDPHAAAQAGSGRVRRPSRRPRHPAAAA